MSYRELLIGCGHDRRKRIPTRELISDRVQPDELPVCDMAGQERWSSLTTLDCNRDVHPDILCDLNDPPWQNQRFVGIRDSDVPCIFEQSFDEVHAYEVLEHLGRQGDQQSFFAHFSEIWRILKPGGLLCATCPSRYSPWLWGDPSHRRVICRESLNFLIQTEYVRQLDRERKTSMSDFRYIYRADFDLIFAHDNKETFTFVMRAVKPSRWRRPE